MHGAKLAQMRLDSFTSHEFNADLLERERALKLREQEAQHRSEVMLAEAAALRAASCVDRARAAHAMAALQATP
jgi:hypothetical protein